MNPLVTTVHGWDTETFRVKPGNQTPPMVCSQWASATRSTDANGAETWTLGRGNVALADEGLWHLVQWLADPTVLIVGAEIAFDVLASVFTVDTTERHLARALGLDERTPGHDLLTRWVAKYDANLVTDILVREKLIDLARGCYRYERHGGRVTGVNKYNLAAVARKRASIDIPEEHKRCSMCDNTGCPACPWRVRYGELHRVPVAQWLPEPRQYAETDGLATGGSWIGQWRYSEEIAANYPETGGNPAWALREEFEETRNSLWLKAMSAYGLRTDPKAVATFAGHVEREYRETAQELVEAGLLNRSYKRDLKAIRAFIEHKGLLEHFTKTSANEPPAFSLARGCYDSGILASQTKQDGGEAAALLWLLREGQYEHEALLAAKLTEVNESKDTKAAEAAVVAAWPDAPLSPACKCERKGTEHACKPDHKTKNGTCPKGKKKLDKDTLELAASLIESRADTGAISKDWAEEQAHVLRLYGELGHLSKQLSTDIPVLLRGSHEPIHTRFESILETMRTSSSGPNVQNQARGGESKCDACAGSGWAVLNVKCTACKGKGKIERPGARECFVPRAGWVLIDADYAMLELHTLAQTCFWLLGHSTLGEALRQGKDPHTIVAAQILGVTYDETKAALADEAHPLHKAAKNARNCGKAVNFGRPGGLSARTMRSYAAKSYGVKKTEAEWKEIIETWNQTWVEMPQYFAVVNRFESYPRSGWFNVSYPGPPGYRAGANYCSACNTLYQRLGAKVAKLAGWYILKGCYVDVNSPLFGCRPVNMIHDQFLIEAPEAQAHEAAVETQRLMNLAGAQLLPDVPVKTEPVLARRWSKNAKEVTADGTKLKDGGRLIAWEDVRLT